MKDKLDRRSSSATESQDTDRHVWPIESLSFLREALLVIVVCMSQFCTQAAFMGTLILLRKIGATFGVDDPPQLAWLVAGYSLTVGTFILISGRLGDIFGYKKLFIIGLVWFSVWSMVAGVSAYSNFTLAVFSRVLQGIGPAICLPNALAVFGVTYPPGHRKAMVFAIFGAVAPNGAVIGCAVSSALDLIWWPWALWAMAIWLAITAVLAWLVIPDLPQEVETKPQGLKGWITTLDLYGAVVGIVALILFNFAFTQSPIDGWATPATLVPLILGIALFVAFLYVEFKVSEKPLLPYDSVSSDVAFVLAAVCCGWASFGVWTLYLTQVLQDIRGLTPLLTTAWFSPVTVSGAIAAVVTGKMLGPWNLRPPVVMVMALACFTTGSILTATAPSNQIYWGQIFVATIIMPWGMDSSFPAATLILSNGAKKEHQGIAASLINTVVNYGIALGVGFAGIVETNLHTGGNSLDDKFHAYRGGLAMGAGLAGLGLLISLVFLVKDTFFRSK
ncbi:major facilitator superfamily protein [Sarocladium implicatum]|nr:major facilitator superfamily protein [Sarocladium implicatum]